MKIAAGCTSLVFLTTLGACSDDADSPAPVQVVVDEDVPVDEDTSGTEDTSSAEDVSAEEDTATGEDVVEDTAVDEDSDVSGSEECEDALCEACDMEGAPFGGGSGTAGDPWLLCTAAQLAGVGTSADYRDGSFVLARDVDMRDLEDDAFVMIGGFHMNTRFIGAFDGNGKEVRHLKINEPESDYIGLFGYIAEGGSVKDLIVVDVDIVGRELVGGLVAITHGTIENVTVSGKVSSTNHGRAGGLAGHNLGTISASHSSVDVASERHDVGGLVGQNDGAITGSSSTGSVSGFFNVGGLVGFQQGTIESSFALGAVSGESNVGGLVGENSDNAQISTSYASATTTAVDGSAGGLVGRNDGEVTSCYASGSVAGGHGYKGGLVGFNRGTITQSYAVTSVSSNFAGESGGLVGGIYMTGDAFHSYWNLETSGVDVSEGGEGLTSAQFGEEASFDESWLFCPATDCLWMMPAGGPPQLEWVAP